MSNESSEILQAANNWDASGLWVTLVGGPYNGCKWCMAAGTRHLVIDWDGHYSARYEIREAIDKAEYVPQTGVSK